MMINKMAGKLLGCRIHSLYYSRIRQIPNQRMMAFRVSWSAPCHSIYTRTLPINPIRETMAGKEKIQWMQEKESISDQFCLPPDWYLKKTLKSLLT